MLKTFSLQGPFGGERRVRLCFPEGKKRLPVLYVFDGQAAFSDADAPFGSGLNLHEFLEREQAKLLVVAPEAGEERLSEYSPFPFRSAFGVSRGLGEGYMRWLTEVLKPYIDGNFPTLTDRAHTSLCGCSLGGLMTVYGLSAFSAYFGRGIAFSPSLWTDAAGCAALLAGIPPSARLYLDYGLKELGRHRGQKESLARAAAALAERGGDCTFRLVKGGEHSELSWRKRLAAAFRCVGLIGEEV